MGSPAPASDDGEHVVEAAAGGQARRSDLVIQGCEVDDGRQLQQREVNGVIGVLPGIGMCDDALHVKAHLAIRNADEVFAQEDLEDRGRLTNHTTGCRQHVAVVDDGAAAERADGALVDDTRLPRVLGFSSVSSREP